MLSIDLSYEELLLLVQRNYVVFLAALVSVAAATVFLSKTWRRPNSGRENGIPGRLGLPFIGETFSFLSAANSSNGVYEFVRLRRQWHGKWFKTRILGQIHVFVPSAEGAKKIYTNDYAGFVKGFVKSMADIIGENSMVCVPQESHKRIRRIFSEPFSMPSLSKFVKTFDEMLCQRLKQLELTGDSFVLHDFTMKLTFDAVCNMLMSITEESLLRQIEKESALINDAMLSFPLKIPGTGYYEGMKARQRLVETFRRIIDRRRRGLESHDDLLQSILQRDSYPPNEKLSDVELMDNLVSMLIAGQPTTAAASMWSVKFLDDNQEALDRLREEQLSIAKNKQDGESLTLEDINRMSYGLKVVKETLRMSNVVLWFPRVATNDCIIDGFEIKKGWHANIDATCIHFDPDLHRDPMRFNCSRFDEMLKPYSYVAFGLGPRMCLGMNMAKVMMLVFLHRLTSGYKWTANDPDPSLLKGHVPRLKTGYPITLKALREEK